MGNVFDEDFQFLKLLDVKAQGKPKRKKQWLLSREYLQPLNEPDDEEDVPSDENDCSSGYKKRLRSGYEAAKYGMKEGVLTGVFFGGCWGIFKHLGENFSLGFTGFGKVEDNNKGGRSSENLPSGNVSSWRSLKSTHSDRSLGRDTSHSGRQSMKNRTFESKKSSFQENISTYTKTLSIMEKRSPEKKFYNETNRLVYKVTNSKLPIRTDNHIATKAGIFEQNLYTVRRNREKVQIVGYAFIHTTGSIIEESGSGSIKSDGSDGTKKTPSKTNKDGKEPTAPSTSQSFNKRVESSHALRKTESKKIESSTTMGQLNSSASIIKTRGHSPKSITDASKPESRQANTVPSARRVTHVVTDESRKLDIAKVKAKSKEGSYAGSPCESPEKRYSKVSELSGEAQPKPLFERRRSSAASALRARRNTETRGSIALDNVYPDPKKTGSVLVNLDDVSNGFTSPPSNDVYERVLRQARAEEFTDSSDFVEPMSKTSVADKARTDTGRSVRYEVESIPRTEDSSKAIGTDRSSKNAAGNWSKERMWASDYPETPHGSRSQMMSGSHVSETPHDSRSQMMSMSQTPNDSHYNMGSSRELRSDFSGTPMDSRDNMRSSRMSRSEIPEASMNSSTNMYGGSGMMRSNVSEAPVDSRYNAQSGTMLGSYSQFNDPAAERRYSGESGLLAKTSYIRETPEEVEYRSFNAEESVRPGAGSKLSFGRAVSSTGQPFSSSVQGVSGQDSGTRAYAGMSASRVGAVGPAVAADTEVRTAEEEEKALKKKNESQGFSFWSGINENVIVLSACNCAIVLGVLCSIICTTRASFT